MLAGLPFPLIGISLVILVASSESKSSIRNALLKFGDPEMEQNT